MDRVPFRYCSLIHNTTVSPHESEMAAIVILDQGMGTK